MDETVLRIKAARDRAERQAIANLARYKFDMFGYHAARWVLLNSIIQDFRPNPLRRLVLEARAMLPEGNR